MLTIQETIKRAETVKAQAEDWLLGCKSHEQITECVKMIYETATIIKELRRI
jgi:hypothetical protein